MGSFRFRARGHLLSSLPLPGRKEESESEDEGLGNYKLGPPKDSNNLTQEGWRCGITVSIVEYSLAIKEETNLLYV